MTPRYVVVEEQALGYLETPNVLVVLGHTEGEVRANQRAWLHAGAMVRDAVLDDFDVYRVDPKGRVS